MQTASDDSTYTLNLSPIRKAYVRRLISEAGFERVRTYGDFQETYAEDDPDNVVSALVASICADIERLLDGKTKPARTVGEQPAFDDLQVIGHGHTA